MNLIPHFFRRKKPPCPDELVRPYAARAKEAILRQDLTKAIAYLNCGIKVAPDRLNLYLQRAQILQYGMNNCSRALEDYRYILKQLEARPDQDLAGKCKQAMRDMMNTGPVETH